MKESANVVFRKAKGIKTVWTKNVHGVFKHAMCLKLRSTWARWALQRRESGCVPLRLPPEFGHQTSFLHNLINELRFC
ncbi:hypothetical protein E2C01_001618 [Portunus trituberculatus]|uniref:Uncharacterized protein n=1 Tax=Portunus trituberculatus TaxID=210409 RepID=A0A5B7CHM6_PORTR|nr:hypothetical protein [Portunus trituberculatus]